MSEFIFGKNIVLEALESGLPVETVFLSPQLKDFDRLSVKLKQISPGITIEKLSRGRMESISGGIRTGGVCAKLPEVHPFKSINNFLSFIKKTTDSPLLIALDEIKDPHNFGAILRSALGAGFHGAVYQRRRQAGVTGVVASTSAGACFKLPLFEVGNLSQSLKELRKSGFWIYGTDKKSKNSVYRSSINTPLILIIGSEDKGLREIVKRSCDLIVSIPLSSKLESLNASVAAGVLMFEIRRKLGGNDVQSK